MVKVCDLAHEEEGRDADEGQGLGERDTDVHEHLEFSGELRLTRHALDCLADDDADTDTGADSGETVTDRRDVAGQFSDVSYIHVGCFLP